MSSALSGDGEAVSTLFGLATGTWLLDAESWNRLLEIDRRTRIVSAHLDHAGELSCPPQAAAL